MVVLQNWSYSCKWAMPHTHNYVCFSILQLLWQPLKLCCIIKFPYFQFFSCSEHPLFYIKRKELEKWRKCGWILLSVIRESCRIKLGFQVPKSYQSAQSASHHPYRWAFRRCLLNDCFMQILFWFLLKIPWLFLSRGLCTCSLQYLKISLSSSFTLASCNSYIQYFPGIFRNTWMA